MSQKKSKPNVPAKADPTTLQVVQQNASESMDQAVGRLAPDPAINAGSIMQSYGNHLGEEVNLMSMIGAVNGITERVKAGDMSDLEGMLVSQATALQTIFTNLARRAQAQQYQRNLEAFLGMALKAQAQSRATISALVDLKYPRTTVIAKQANVANGPQQVNQGFESSTRARGGEVVTEESRLLEGVSDGSTYLDAGAASATTGGNSALEAVGAVNRPANRRGKGQGGKKPLQGRGVARDA